MHFLPDFIWDILSKQQSVNLIPPPLIDLTEDVWKLIFSNVIETNYKDFSKCTLVSKKWKQLANDSQLIKKMIYEGFCFNPMKWNDVFGIGTVSRNEIEKAFASLPIDIDKILKSNCPALGVEGYKIIDTHALIWIPETIKAEPVNIVNFGKLLKKRAEFSEFQSGYKFIQDEVLQQEGDKPIKSGWMLIIEEIPNSRLKSYLKQKILLERLNLSQKNYRVPKLGEAIVSFAINALKPRSAVDKIKYLVQTILAKGFRQDVKKHLNLIINFINCM